MIRAALGIDLGSTTCKAVLLDEAGVVIGKGITNTRSNYRIAADIAADQAMTQARFLLLKQSGRLPGSAVNDGEMICRMADYRHRHRILAFRLQELAEKRRCSGLRSFIERMKAQVDSLLQPEVFSASAEDVFFKDFIYACYLKDDSMRMLDAADRETFMELLDQAVVFAENDAFPLEALDFSSVLSPFSDRDFIEDFRNVRIAIAARVGTGYGRQLLPFPEAQIRSEILCHGKGAHHLYPETRTVLDIGGQDTKAIQIDRYGAVTSFFMNDRCAAGCGRYLGYVAEELGVAVSALGRIACTACRGIPITSTCTVFAGTELRSLLYGGEKQEAILKGLHRAIVLRALSLLARSGGVFSEFTFTGGVARNEAVVAILEELVAQKYPGITVRVHPDAIYTGALGAALYAREAL